MRNAVRRVAKRRAKKANIETPTMEGVSHFPELGVDVDVDIDVDVWDAWKVVVWVTVGVGAMASNVCSVCFGNGGVCEDRGCVCC